ncbi:MAG: TetR/AcrR family transcriptional regulator [Bacillota bacterium]
MDMKERILAGFKELAFTAGFHAATVDELSARTGISKRTIYRYFKSKDEMVNAVMDELMAATEKNITSALASADTPVEKVLSLIRVASQNLRIVNPLIMRDMQKYYPHVWKRIEDFRARRVRTVIEMQVTGNMQGYFRETIPEVFTTALLASIRDVLNPGFLLENNLTLEKAMVALFDIFLYGIVSDGARKPDGKNGPLPKG